MLRDLCRTERLSCVVDSLVISAHKHLVPPSQRLRALNQLLAGPNIRQVERIAQGACRRSFSLDFVLFGRSKNENPATIKQSGS